MPFVSLSPTWLRSSRSDDAEMVVFGQRHKALDADLVRTIHGFDALLVLTGSTASANLLALALHALPAGNLTFAGGIERSVANLDLTLSLVMADGQAIWRDAGPSQLERMRRRAVGEQLFAAAKHDRHCEDAHSVDQVIGEQRVDEFGTALGDEVRAVFLLQALHGGDVAQEHGARPARLDLA